MLRILRLRQLLPAFLCIAVVSLSVSAQTELSTETKTRIDQLVNAALTKSGVPSVSVAVVRGGQIVYLKAYGDARLDPKTAATPQMRYSIGSISKQFTATAILLLQEQGKLSLDDKVGKFIPDLTRANEVTIRQLLSHTSGYQDYWPQDYVMPMMLQPVTARKIMDTWARKPLDFEPGTKWQYSNTNFVIAGAIVEKVTGKPFMQFLQDNIFTPLGMSSATLMDVTKASAADPVGYLRYGLGPLRPAPKEGAGWLFAAAELAMTAEDLAKWDISIIDQKLLKPMSYRELEHEVQLTNGIGTHYALGLDVAMESGHRSLSHGGEVSGFTAENVVFPDDGMAVVALTNQDAMSTSGEIAHGIVPLLFEKSDPVTPMKTEQAKKIFEGLQHHSIDRTLFTDNANAYFSEQAMDDFARGLAPLGTPKEFVQTRQALRGGMTLRVYRVGFPKKTLRVWTYEMPDGKLEQYQIAVQE